MIGLMGAGKTTIGRRLARELGMTFVDTDELVVTMTGRTIAEIFADEGEPGFRARELAAAREAFAGTAAVVSLGGGAVTHDLTRELVARAAVRVYLRMPAHTILSRLCQSPTVRPLVGTTPTLETIEGLMRNRKPFYCEAEVTVAADRGSTGAIARRIVARLHEHARAARG